jgi:hypothetical protein
VSDLEFDTISDRIRLLLLKGEFSLDELVSKVVDHHESQALKVIEWMIDNSKIKYVRGNTRMGRKFKLKVHAGLLAQ